MSKLVRYELHRMIYSRVFVGMACVLIWYGRQILNGKTILGAAYTAPFSPWSFGDYLSTLMPMLSLSLLFFLWEAYSGPARKVEILADATPLGHDRLMLAKGGAASMAWLLLSLGTALSGTIFLVRLFGDAVPLGEYMAVIILEIIPVLLFFVGLGMLAGQFHTRLLFLLIPIILFFRVMPLPMEAQLFCSSFFSLWPAGQELDFSFYIPFPVILGRLLYGGVGLGGIAAAVRISRDIDKKIQSGD